MKVTYKGQEVDAQPVEILSQEELWNSYQLSDGTLLRMKAVVTDILRIPGELDAKGNAVYMVNSNNITHIRPAS